MFLDSVGAVVTGTDEGDDNDIQRSAVIPFNDARGGDDVDLDLGIPDGTLVSY